MTVTRMDNTSCVTQRRFDPVLSPFLSIIWSTKQFARCFICLESFSHHNTPSDQRHNGAKSSLSIVLFCLVCPESLSYCDGSTNGRHNRSSILLPLHHTHPVPHSSISHVMCSLASGGISFPTYFGISSKVKPFLGPLSHVGLQVMKEQQIRGERSS